MVLFLGSTPNMDELKSFVSSLYGECKIVPSPQERKALQSSLEHAEPELIQGDVTFVPKKPWEGLKFPELRPLNKTEQEKKLDDIVAEKGSSDEFKDAYKVQLIKKAEIALYKLNLANKRHQALMLKNELDTYRTVAREYGENSRARVEHQLRLESRLVDL